MHADALTQKRTDMSQKLKWLLISLSILVLTACGTTGHRSKIPYQKPPLNVSVGAGPNRAIAVEAMKYRGTPYYFGGSSPSEGFDCSGLIQYSSKRALNLNLPRTSAQQSQFGQEIDLDELAAGDVVFFNTSSQPNSHSGIYIGDNYFVHAPSSGGVVRVDSLSNPYWQPRIYVIRRVK
jgi:cell wall-associated NlpC family hydrolase